LNISIKSLIKNFISEFNPSKNVYDRIFIYILALSILLRALWLDIPDSLIFDEKHYVNAVRVILSIPPEKGLFVGATPGIDPIPGHPPLAKGIIAFSMMILGDNPYGYRIPSVIFAAFSIFIFYLLAKRLSSNPKFSLIAVFLFSFESLFFIHSRIATLDIFMLTFMIFGLYWLISGNYILSAISIALSTISKYPGMFAVLVVIGYVLLKKNNASIGYELKSRFIKIERFVIAYVITLLSTLAILGWLYGGYINPFDQIILFFKSASQLAKPTLEGIASYPWQWLLNENQIPYHVTNVNVLSGGEVIRTYPSRAFWGAMNPAILYLVIPSIAFVTYRYWRTRDNLCLFTLLWFIFTYLPYYPMSIIMHRIMYIFYFLSAIPPVCLAIAYGLTELKISNKKLANIYRISVYVYLLLVLVGFYLYFPFKVIP
jgi:predicted membrane-bound dolichyl-phosphate-mannose-protein mannosyltransferase